MNEAEHQRACPGGFLTMHYNALRRIQIIPTELASVVE